MLSGGEAAVAREVRGAHTVEVDEPARWLDRGWIMLTTGVRLRGNAEAQRALVPELEARGASALGFGVGLGFKRVPPALLEVARERGFPVFSVPYETPFREIIRFIDGSEERTFRRLTALQRFLVDALRTPRPQQAILDRLARFLDAGAALGELTAGRVPEAEVLGQIGEEPAGRGSPWPAGMRCPRTSSPAAGSCWSAAGRSASWPGPRWTRRRRC